MKRVLTEKARQSYQAAPAAVRKAFDKQATLLEQNLRHPSLRAKKYDDAKNRWQARVNRDWRFYFTIEGDIWEFKAVPMLRRAAASAPTRAGRLDFAAIPMLCCPRAYLIDDHANHVRIHTLQSIDRLAYRGARRPPGKRHNYHAIRQRREV